MQQLFINYIIVSFSNSSSPCLVSSDFLSSFTFEHDNDDNDDNSSIESDLPELVLIRQVVLSGLSSKPRSRCVQCFFGIHASCHVVSEPLDDHIILSQEARRS